MNISKHIPVYKNKTILHTRNMTIRHETNLMSYIWEVVQHHM